MPRGVYTRTKPSHPAANKGKGKAYAFLRSLVGHTGNECVVWPFSRLPIGYGMLGYNGKRIDLGGSAAGVVIAAEAAAAQRCLLRMNAPRFMKSENSKLRDALSPFTKVPLDHTADIDDAAIVMQYEGGELTLGDFRRVHSALSTYGGLREKTMKHTQGPWEANNSLTFWRIRGPHKECIADTGAWPGDEMQEMEANAHLLAAAPRLKDALLSADRLVTAAQKILERTLYPDSAFTAELAVRELLQLLDGDDAEIVSRQTRQALSQALGVGGEATKPRNDPYTPNTGAYPW